MDSATLEKATGRKAATASTEPGRKRLSVSHSAGAGPGTKKPATADSLADTQPAPAASKARRVRRARGVATKAIGDTIATAGRGTMQVAGGLVDLVAEASHHTLAASPLIGLKRQDLAAAGGALLKVIATAPRAAVRQMSGTLKELGRVIKGDSALEPDPRDRRFADPAWRSNFLYQRMMKAYLVAQKDLAQLIERSELDRLDKGRAQFFASLVIDALAPSNWLLGNPAAVRRILDTGGRNLVDGLKNLFHDARYNHLLPSQVDASGFKLGENIATSRGQVVYRNEMFELLQFAPTTPQVYRRPLVMSPPQINKYYVIDLAPEKSLLKWALDCGVQMFVVSWRNPTIEHRHWGLEDYALALDDAVEVARQISGSADVNMWGSCAGGMTLAAYLGWLAGTGQQAKVANTTWAVCVLDAQAGVQDTTLSLFDSPAALRLARARSVRRGLVTGDEMASAFAWLRPNDLIWNYWVNNYLLGNKPPAFDILAWNADTTRLPGQFHADLIDLVAGNPYVNAGRLEIDDVPIDVSRVKVGAYVIGGITDHITPWNACYGTARLLGEDSTFVLANAGHIQSLINPPGTPKSYFFAGKADLAEARQWAARAQSTRQEGSWWPHWRGWIQARSGELVEAPKRLGSRKFKPLAAAPGEYVMAD
jgi:polyhydroxyalkanoate synthase